MARRTVMLSVIVMTLILALRFSGVPNILASLVLLDVPSGENLVEREVFVVGVFANRDSSSVAWWRPGGLVSLCCLLLSMSFRGRCLVAKAPLLAIMAII
jgi:hypothetical protein